MKWGLWCLYPGPFLVHYNPMSSLHNGLHKGETT
jgi:hypothetical protein